MKLLRVFPLALVAMVSLSQAETLVVFAAASLREPFRAIGERFERTHPGVSVSLNFAGSQQLAAQIGFGAPADVFASAGAEPMRTLGIPTSQWRWFAENRLALIVPTASTKVRTLADLGKNAKLVVADRRVPVGAYTDQLLRNLSRVYGSGWVRRVEKSVVSREQDVRAVLAKIELGEADAGIVYVSDVPVAKGRVRSIPIPDACNPIARYPVVALTGLAQQHVATEFIHSIFDAASQQDLTRQGFISPIAPVRNLLVNGRPLPWISVGKIVRTTLEAQDAGQKLQPYRGIDLRAVFELLYGTKWQAKNKAVLVTGADGYEQTVEMASVVAGNVLLSPLDDGNWRIIVKGAKPRFWVKWVRKVDAR